MTPKQFLTLADMLPEALLLLTSDGTVVAANKAAGCFLDTTPSALKGRSLSDLVDNDAQQVQHQLRLWSRSRLPLPSPLDWRVNTKQPSHWSCQGFLLCPKQDQQPAYLVVRCKASRSPARDFVALNRELRVQHRMLHTLNESREALAREYEKAVVTLSSIGDGVITTDAAGNVEYLNPIAEHLTGWSTKDAAGKPLQEVFRIINELTRRPAIDPVARCLSEGRVVGLANHTALIARDGNEYVIEDSAAPIRNHRGEVFGAVLVFRDVTDDRLALRQMEYLAQHDTLTGLYNRHYFETQLEQAVQLARRNGRMCAMFYLDLDQFKIVNDTAGHSVGDELLGEVARLFARRVRQGDVLARLGGDEFGVLLHDVENETAQLIAQDFLKTIAGFRFKREGQDYDISASIGVATFMGTGARSAAEVMRQADIACYVAKRAGRNTYHVYSDLDEADMAAISEMSLVGELRSALAEDRFELHYQPIVATDGGKVMFHEVLLRMRDRDDNLVSPATFIGVAERYGLMQQIDRWVFENAFRVLEARSAHGQHISLSINLSGASIGDAELLELIKERLKNSVVNPATLMFEVTETAAVAQIENAGTFMHELNVLGCRFALDDFGTGFSSYAYLKYLPVDFLKIDGTFIRDMPNDPVDQAMVRSINQIAHSLDKQTIAEFVENEEIMSQLKAMGVDMAQGYHIGRPSPELG